MMFHYGTDLPEKTPAVLDHESPDLTAHEIRILKDQILKNGRVIAEYLSRLDLLVNKERYPQKAEFLGKIREKLNLLMDENDTFREVLWKHFQQQELKQALKKRPA
jgi:hypothetical protein